MYENLLAPIKTVNTKLCHMASSMLGAKKGSV